MRKKELLSFDEQLLCFFINEHNLLLTLTKNMPEWWQLL